jgi:hypothetical protein
MPEVPHQRAERILMSDTYDQGFVAGRKVADLEKTELREKLADALTTIGRVSSAVNGPQAPHSGLDSFTLAHISAVLGEGKATDDPQRPKIVCLCGSTRFRDLMEEVAADFTRWGWIVVMPNVWDRSITGRTSEEKAALDALHKRKIDLADLVFVVNPDDYVGDSTRGEIAYAVANGKPVQFTNHKTRRDILAGGATRG